MQLKLSFVAGLIATSALAVAAPLEQQERGINVDISKRATLTVPGTDKVDFEKVKLHMDRLRAKYAKSLANFEKNTGKAHVLKRDLPEHLAKRATGTVALTDEQGDLWSGTTAFGTPAQSFPIDFDTGSSDTLVNPGVYNPSASSTSQTNGDQFSTAYGDGTTAQGTIYTDTIHIAGLSAPNTAIGVSNSQFMDPSSGAQGISGMAFPQLAAFGSNYPPYFYSLKNAGAVSSGVFQFDLRTSGSTLFLGGTNSAKYSSTPIYQSVDNSQGYWTVPATVDGTSIQSIVDTGTTLIVAPPSQATAFFNKIGLPYFTQDGTTYAYYNCNSPPTITFKYGGYTKSLSAATETFGTTNTGQCVLSIVGEDVGINAWVTGDAWLQNTVAIFDTDNNRVGFANKA